MAEPLATLLHISDLHIGDVDPTSGDHTLDAEVLHLWRTAPVFQGYLGHTHVALAQLVDLWNDLVLQEPQPVVVVTGDITATGATGQYATATTYLQSALQDPLTGAPLGLGLGAGGNLPWIPGNHDHWPGKPCKRGRLVFCMLGEPTAGLGGTFPKLPIPVVRRKLTHACELVIAGLDSDADVGKVGRIFARGSFATQCGSALATLGKPKENELRVLLVHHSTIESGVPDFKLRIEPESRRRLAALVKATGIAMVLTGHQHRVDYARPEDDATVDIREARCGTTTARDYFDRNSGLFGGLPRNTTLIHRLYDDGNGGIQWETEVCARRTAAGPFERWQERVNFGRVWP